MIGAITFYGKLCHPLADPSADPTVVSLSRRERDIVFLLVEGRSNKEIASRLGISDQTVKNQLSQLYQKAGVASRLQLVVYAIRTGLVGT